MMMTVIVMHCNIFLMKFLSLLPWCQVWLDDVVYPWFFFFVYSLDKKGKDLNLFFFDWIYIFCSFLLLSYQENSNEGQSQISTGIQEDLETGENAATDGKKFP